MPRAEQAGWRLTLRGFGTDLQFGTFYLVIRLGGRRAAYALLSLVTSWYVLLRPAVRRSTAPYLGRRFPGAGPVKRLAGAWRMSYAFGQALVDRAVAGMLGPSSFDVVLHGREQILAEVARGRGLVIVMAHAGPWQMAVSALSFLPVGVTMLMRPEEDSAEGRYLRRTRPPNPYRTVDPAGFLGGSLELLAALRRGETVVFMGDRVFGGRRSTVRLPFLGAEAPFPSGPYRLAAAAGAPLAVIFAAKTGSGSYELRLWDLVEPPPEGSPAHADPLPAARRFVLALEGYVRRHPYQFFNFYDLWNSEPPLNP